MKEPNDNLNQLLAQAPPPQAPPWFEQRLMARLRREQEARPVFAWSWRWTSLAAAGCLLVMGSAVWWHGRAPQQTPVAQAREEIYQGLDAFAAYQEQSQSWNIEW